MSEKVTISRKECYEAFTKLREKDSSVIGDFNTAVKIIQQRNFQLKDQPEPRHPKYKQYISQKTQLGKEIKCVLMMKKQKGVAKLSGNFFDSSKFKDLTYLQTSGTCDLYQDPNYNAIVDIVEGQITLRCMCSAILI